jgi:hypothetical protein
MRLVEDMKDQRVTFEVEAICALSRVHLQRGGTQDVVDLLNTHVLPYGWKKRAAVRDVLVSFCLDQPQTIARLWDTYTILRQLFPEVDVDTRTKFMIEFFERGRSDMACHVFGHMRRQDPGIMRPTVDTYVACFEGIGKAKDKESLEMVHNMLKLDTQIEPNTKLYNSLMLAFTGCGEARRGLNIWVDIVDSREGPAYGSIEIALRACEEAPFGDRNARGIWARLKEYNVKITKEIFAAYIGALAGNAQFEECVKLIEEFEKVPGYAPDAFLLGTFYNAMIGDDNKKQVEEWGSTTHPSAWKDLVALGHVYVQPDLPVGLDLNDIRDANGIHLQNLQYELLKTKLFKIDRDLRA